GGRGRRGQRRADHPSLRIPPEAARGLRPADAGGHAAREVRSAGGGLRRAPGPAGTGRAVRPGRRVRAAPPPGRRAPRDPARRGLRRERRRLSRRRRAGGDHQSQPRPAGPGRGPHRDGPGGAAAAAAGPARAAGPRGAARLAADVLRADHRPPARDLHAPAADGPVPARRLPRRLRRTRPHAHTIDERGKTMTTADTTAAPASTTGAAVVVRDLTKTFGATRALDGFSLTVPTGQVTGFLGPNG